MNVLGLGKVALQVSLVGGLTIGLGLGIRALESSHEEQGGPAAVYPVSHSATGTGRPSQALSPQGAQRAQAALSGLMLREMLPEAPSGWTRRFWLADDPAAFRTMGDDQDRAVRESHVYQAGTQAAALRLSHRPADETGLRSDPIVAMVGGVVFRERGGVGSDARGRPLGLRTITGDVGPDLRLTLRGEVTDQAAMTLLGSIDYDRLNVLIGSPASGPSNDRIALDPEQSRILADAATATEETELHHRAAATVARQLLRSNDTDTEAAIYRVIGAYYPDHNIVAKAVFAGAVDDALQVQGAALAAAQPPQERGFLGQIGGLFSGGEPEIAEGDMPELTRIGFNCTVNQGFKKCTASH